MEMPRSWKNIRRSFTIISALSRKNMKNLYTIGRTDSSACTAKIWILCAEPGVLEDYSWQDIYDYCKMRLDNGAAVVRFKFGGQEAFSEACQELLDDGVVQNVAQYYMKLHGLGQVEYHYGVMDNFYTIYFIF